MRYRLITQPTVGPGKITQELERLLKNAKRLTTSLVVVGPPHKRVLMMATVLEVPDVAAPMALRVLEVVLGPSGNCEPQKAITARAEWVKHALLEPHKGAQPLVETLFDGWSSACVQVHWRPGRCVGIIHYSEGDAARVAALAAHGWKARVLPATMVEGLATLRLSLPWVGRVAHQPFLGKPLITPTAQSVVAVTSGGKSMIPASLFSGHQESVFQPDSTIGPKHASLGQPRRTGIGTVLAPRGGDGFPLGTTLDGQAVRLAWHALLLAVVAPEDRQRDLVRTLVTRAMEHDLGLIAVLPLSLLSTRQLAAWSARVRVLDPRNLWESHAIPWHTIDPVLLREALADAGVEYAPTLPLPATFGEFLSTAPGGAQYCTDAVLALTAPEGDDLRSVVDAGGGVLLLDDASPGGRLLSMLLFALLATNPQIDRRMLLIRSAQTAIPAALAQRSMQVVFGDDDAALGTLRAAGDSWRLTHADGSPAIDLDADLNRPSSELDETSYATLMDTLTGEAPSMALGGTLTDDDADPFAIPFVVPISAAPDDALFAGVYSVESRLAPPSRAVVPSDTSELFRFDSALEPTAAAAPAGNAFTSFFDIPLGGAAAAPVADWLASSAALDLDSAAQIDDLGGEFAMPDADEPAIGGAFVDFIAQPLDALAAPPETVSTDADMRSHVPDDQDVFGLDLFGTTLEFAGIPATALEDDAAAFGAVPTLFDADSIFPSLASGPWESFPVLSQDAAAAPDLPQAEIAAPVQPPVWDLPVFADAPGLPQPERSALVQPPVWDLPVFFDTGAFSALASAARAEMSIVPELDAATELPRAASLSDVPVVQPTVLLDAPDMTAGVEEASVAAPAAPEQVADIEATAELPTSARRVNSRRRRGWTPPRRVDNAAGSADGSARVATALPSDDAVLPLDALTLALTTGDLDLTPVDLFAGDDFALPPVAPDAPVADAAVVAQEAPPLELNPGAGLLDFLSRSAEQMEEQPVAGSPAPDAWEGVDAAPDLPALVGMNRATLQTLTAAPDIDPIEDPETMTAAPILYGALEPVAPTIPALPAMPMLQRTSTELVFDAAVIHAAWGGGIGMAELVDVVARQNPAADRSLIRRTIRALLATRTTVGTLASTLPTPPLVPYQAPAIAATPALDMALAPLDADSALDTAVATPLAPDLVLDTGGYSGMPETAPADVAPIAELPVDDPRTADGVAMASAPLDADSALDTAVAAPFASDLVLDTSGDSGMPETAPADVAPIAELPIDAIRTGDAGIVAPAPEDTRLRDDALWADWSSGVELTEIVRAISGYARGHAADVARDHVYRVVVPRIVTALNADMLVRRVLQGRTPLPSQASQFEELLRQMNRQSSQVTGIIREKTIARLHTSMHGAPARIVAAA